MMPANPFRAALLRGVDIVSRARGVLPRVGSTGEGGVRERELAEALLSRRVDGVIVVSFGRDQSYLQPETDAGAGLLFVDRPPAFIDADCVLSGNARGVAAGTSPACHGPPPDRLPRRPRDDLHRARAPGRVSRGARRRGVPFRPGLVRMNVHDSAAAADATAGLLAGEDPSTALFSARNLITIGVVDRLCRLGRHRELALVGFDDLTLADAVEPGLTVIAQNGLRLGRVTAERAFARIDGDRGPAQRVIADPAREWEVRP